jgi:hypothetical protein
MSDGKQPSEPRPRAAEDRALRVPPIPWERRRELGNFVAFCQTLTHIMRRNGRLEREAEFPLSYREARAFRWRVVLWGTWPLGIAGFLLLAAGLKQVNDEMPMGWTLLVVGFAGPPLAAATLAVWTGVASWFFETRKLPTERQEAALAVSYYVSAPLSLLCVPGFVAIPAAIAEASKTSWILSWVTLVDAEPPNVFELPPAIVACALVAGGILVLYCLQMTLIAARRVVGRGLLGMVATGLGLPALWAVSAAAIIHLPLAALVLYMMGAIH